MDSETAASSGSFGCGFIIAFLVISLFWGIGKNGKYEGQTAEEWFNEYDNAEAVSEYCQGILDDYQSCVEDTIPNIENYCYP